MNSSRAIWFFLVLVLAACDRPAKPPAISEDSKLRSLLIGDWPQSKYTGMTFFSDGSFYSRWGHLSTNGATRKEWIYEGTWQVEDGFLVLVATNVIAKATTNAVAIGSVERFKILMAGSNRVAFIASTSLNSKDVFTTNFMERK